MSDLDKPIDWRAFNAGVRKAQRKMVRNAGGPRRPGPKAGPPVTEDKLISECRLLRARLDRRPIQEEYRAHLEDVLALPGLSITTVRRWLKYHVLEWPPDEPK